MSSIIIVNNNNMLIKMLSLVMAMIIVQSSICQSLVIPDSQSQRLKAERQRQDSSSSNVRQRRSTIAGEPLWDGNDINGDKVFLVNNISIILFIMLINDRNYI